MTNKTAKRSLVLSVISLLLCCSMLIGTTFAWFTDTTTTGVNTIQSGKLDVVLEYFDKESDSWKDAEGLVLDFEDLDDNKLWEPGCTYNMPQLRVRNNGNLALKYQVAISGLTGDTKLLEVIEWTVNEETLVDVYSGTLAAGAASEPLQITGHMLETAGNDYMDLKIENISIAVYATQLNAESDSFGPDYDKNAWHPDMIVYTAADLEAALANGGNIQMGADITLTEAWTPVGTEAAPFTGTFDGNGYTISGLTIDADYAALFAYLGDGATVKNLKLENVNVTGKWAAGVAYMANGATIENVEVSGTVTSTNNYAAGVVVRGTGTTVKNCKNYATVDGAYLGAGVAAWMPSATIEGCENYGSVTGAERAAGIVALVSGTVTDCTNNGDVTANGSMPAGGIVAVVNGATTIEGCTNNGDVTATANSKYNASAAGILGHTPSAKVSIINCVNTGKITSAYSVAAGIGVSQYGGITATNCSNSGEINGATGSSEIVAAKGMFGGNNTIN